MAKVTYTDADGSAPAVTTHGRSFADGEAVDISDTAENQRFLDMAEGNPHFKVTDRSDKVAPTEVKKVEATDSPDPRVMMGAAPSAFIIPDESPSDAPADPYSRGSHAAATGKAKSVPPAYRGKQEGKDWTTGYEDWTTAHAEQHPPMIQSPGTVAGDS